MSLFIVRHYDANDYATSGWHVYLPHRCEDWEISQDEFTPWDATGLKGHRKTIRPDREKAIEQLTAFLADGQLALKALERGKEYGEDE